MRKTPWQLYRSCDFANDPPPTFHPNRTPCVYLLSRPERGWPKPDRLYWLVKIGKTQRSAFKRASECRHNGFEAAVYWPILAGRIGWWRGRKSIDRCCTLASAEARAIEVMKAHCGRQQDLGIEFYRTGALAKLVEHLDTALDVPHVTLDTALLTR